MNELAGAVHVSAQGPADPDRFVPDAAWHHAVQFYEDDGFLCRAVARYLAPALITAQPAIVIAVPAHREAILAHLRGTHGCDPDTAILRGDLVTLDARDTLATFMVDGQPDAARFAEQVGSVLMRVRRGRDRVRVHAYGEMVDVLWRVGMQEAALALEGFWNTLGAESEQGLSLLCGYSMRHFSDESQRAPFEDVCRQHTHVAPTERYAMVEDDDARQREITRLQQRAIALETEIAHRKELERALRQALAARDRAESDRARLLTREQKARAEAEDASRLKDEFLALLSHELRTPLNAILGWAHIADDERSDESTTRRAVGIIRRNAALQLHLIDDLLDISRIMAGKMGVHMDRVDLIAMLTTALDLVRPSAEAKDIRLDLHVDATARFATGDPDRLQQIMWNLLSNAIKFTPASGRVEVSLDVDDTTAHIEVRDTGRGIARDFLPHVFDPFRQAETGTTRTHNGLGLGLAVVKYLVEAHGGTVEADSPGEGLGATFTLTIPVRGRT